jgi:hypothetical protein
MRVLKSIMRWFFAMQAASLIFIPVVGLLGRQTKHTYVVSLQSHIAACAVFLVLSLPFALRIAAGCLFTHCTLAWEAHP